MNGVGLRPLVGKSSQRARNAQRHTSLPPSSTTPPLMTHLQSKLSPRRPSPRRGGLLVGLLGVLLVAGIIGGIGYKYYLDNRAEAAASQLITQTALRGPFDHVVAVQGEIESSSNTEVICEVESRGSSGVSILWVVDEGTRVKRGDKLVELDSSQLELQLKEKKIRVIGAKASVTSAAAVVEQAKIAKEEYLQGVFLTEEKTILSDIAIAEQNLRKAELAIKSSERLVAKGLIKSLQLDADRFAVSNAQNKLEADKAKLKVLRELTKRKMLVQFDSDIEAAMASLSAAESELQEEENELQELETQIAKCVLYAPADGVVVHANRYSSRGGSAEFVVEPGAIVRERQTLIRLPDPSQMQVICKINESRITMIDEGMPTRISVDAIPGLELTGRVSKVNRYAEPGSWYSSSIKEYATYIQIIDPPESIRTGMTADVRIFVEQLDDAVQIPIQGLYEHDGDMYSLLQKGPGMFETVQVKIGATNDTMATIEQGVEQNDQVVLNLRQHLSLLDLPEVRQEDNRELRQIREQGQRLAARSDSVGDGSASGANPAADDATARSDREAGDREGRGEQGAAGRPDVNAMVTMSLSRNDTDGDGSLSAEEIANIDQRFQSMVKAADRDGDGIVTRAELKSAIQQRIGGGGDR